MWERFYSFECMALFLRLELRSTTHAKTCLCSCCRSRAAVYPQMVLATEICLQWEHGTNVNFQACGTQSVFTSLPFLLFCSLTASQQSPMTIFPHPLWEHGNVMQVRGAMEHRFKHSSFPYSGVPAGLRCAVAAAGACMQVTQQL